MGWQQQLSSSSEREGVFDCRLYQDSGNWELFLLFSLFRISCQLFFFLYRFSLAMLVLLIMLASSLGQRKNTSSSYFYNLAHLLSDVDELSKPKQCTCTAPGPCIVMSKAFNSASHTPYVERDRSLAGRLLHGGVAGRVSVSTSSRNKVNTADSL